jgi:hypothetical protein
MRLSETKVIQLVESEPPQLVILEEVHGAEISLTPQEVVNLGKALDYFAEHVPAYQRAP